MKAKHAVLAISGYNTRAVIAFCRWANARNVPFHLVAFSGDDPIFLTKYKAHVAFIRPTLELRAELFIEWTESLLREHGYGQILVLPSTEYLNRFLLSQREDLEKAGCQVPLVDEALYLQLSNKHSFATLCAAHSLDVPQEFLSLPTELPFVAKPRSYLSRTGRQLKPHLVDTSQDLERFLCEEDREDFFYQEHVAGRSLYLLACIRENGNDVLFSQENLMQQARGGSIILAKHSDFHGTPIAGQYITMLRNLKFTGLIMIEIRYDEASGRHCMIEANPRPWGPIQFAVDNGIDLFGALLSDHGVTLDGAPPPISAGDIFYFWSGGIRPAADPIRYHRYSSEQFIRDLPSLWQHDLFLRQDTLGLHHYEHRTAPLREY